MLKNRYFWLLALPYVITFSTAPYRDCMIVREDKSGIYKVRGSSESLMWPYYEDMVAALNEAHERRTKKCDEYTFDGKCLIKDDLYWKDSKKAEWEKPLTITAPTGNPKSDKDLIPVSITNKEACGQDDCGAEAK